jgi:hypothetical protein
MSKKETVESVNIMEGVDFEKSRYQQRKREKTRRIHKQAIQAKRKRLKIVLTIELVIISAIIYFLTGEFGGSINDELIYQIWFLLSWGWLLGGQIVAIAMIWSE